jgi:hypothetical protein
LSKFLWLSTALLAITTTAFADWQLQCGQGKCRVLSYTDKLTGYGPVRFLAEFNDRGEFIVTPVETREQHRRYFTSNPPTHAILENRDYVVVRDFINDRFPALLRVDGNLVGTTSVVAKAQFILPKPDVARLIEAAKQGRELQLEYANVPNGKGQTVSFQLSGLSKTLSRLSIQSGSRPTSKSGQHGKLLGPPDRALPSGEEVAGIALPLRFERVDTVCVGHEEICLGCWV